MYKNKRILCTICARGGSKRLPGKNKKMIAGKPLIAHTIETAKKCNYIDDIIVSTEDVELMKIASEYGAPPPFKRPKYLATDDVSRVEVIKHALSWAEQNLGAEYDIIVDLSVVSPLRSVEDIETSIALLVDENADNVFSVSPPYRNPYFNVVEITDGRVKLVKEPPERLRVGQDAPQEIGRAHV